MDWGRMTELMTQVAMVWIFSYLCIKLLALIIKKIQTSFPDFYEFMSNVFYLGTRIIGYALLCLFAFGSIIAIGDSLFNGQDRDCEYAVGASGLICE